MMFGIGSVVSIGMLVLFLRLTSPQMLDSRENHKIG